MTTLSATDTDRVLVGMLVENTGRHFLDSGGAHGRAWQINRAIVGDSDPVDAFFNADPAHIDRWCGPRLNLFHYLRERITYMPDLDRRWRLWCWLDNTARWQDGHRFLNSPSTVDDFVQAWIDKGWADPTDDLTHQNGLTYNHDNLLDQDFQYRTMVTTAASPVGHGTWIAVSIHGGADIRGGYTDYRWFDLDGYGGYCRLLDWDRCTVYVTCPACAVEPDPNQLTAFDPDQYGRPPRPGRWIIDTTGYHADVLDDDGHNVDVDMASVTDRWDEPTCPTCGGPVDLTIEPPCTG